MKELTTIHNALFELYEQLSQWEHQYQYMTKHHIINEELINQVVIAVNHCSFQVRESVYPILHRVVLVDAPVIKLAKSLINELQELEQRIIMIENAGNSLKKATYLFILTLETSNLLTKSKFMIRKEEASIENGVKIIVPNNQVRVAV
ncbi:MAG: hypothetical protein ACPGXZ_02630 [Saprospiraceae bacterium]